MIKIKIKRRKVMETLSIASAEELYDRVVKGYQQYDTELDHCDFDFEVCMREREIIETYAKLQNNLKGDEVARIKNEIICSNLIPEKAFDKIYVGNCSGFLKRFNDQILEDGSRFVRFYGAEKLDFIL